MGTAVTNEAGDQELATSGQIMAGIRTRGGTLIITDTDGAHLAQYQGPPLMSTDFQGSAQNAVLFLDWVL